MEKDLYLSMMGAYDEVYLSERRNENRPRVRSDFGAEETREATKDILGPSGGRIRGRSGASRGVSSSSSSESSSSSSGLSASEQERLRQDAARRRASGEMSDIRGTEANSNTTKPNDSKPTATNDKPLTKSQINTKYDSMRKSDPTSAVAFGKAQSARLFGNNAPKTPNPLLSRPVSTTSAVPQMSGSASASTGSKPSTPSSSLNTPKPKTFNAINPRMRSRMESMDNQRYHSMRDAYKAMYEAKVVVGKGPALQAAVVLPKPSVTKVNVEVNPQETKVGDVDQAYYTFPAGFDPTNREDVASKSKKVEYKAEEVEVTDEEFFEFMVENGITENLESAEAIFEHMSDEWFDSIYTGLIEAKNAEGKEQGLDGKACWKGYRRAGTKQKGGKTVDNCVKM